MSTKPETAGERADLLQRIQRRLDREIDYDSVFADMQLLKEAAALLAADGKAGGEVAQDGYLCQAWGETDTPCAEVVWDLEGVRAFMAREWFGNVDDPDIEPVIQEIAEHNFKDEGDWHVEFEIGGVSVKQVYSFTRPKQQAVNGIGKVNDVPAPKAP